MLKSYDRIGEQVYTEFLPNGMPVLFIPKPGFTKQYAFFAVNYGGADRRFRLSGRWVETPEGIAHFLEHKMFDMEDGNALAQLSANGASPNAFTSSDMTAYYFECTERFYENLAILLRFVTTPFFTQSSVEKERGIIGQEIAMTRDNPRSELYYNLMKCLYRQHPLRDSVAGTAESISQITPQVLYDCHRAFYTPANMVLCIAGDLDFKQILRLCLDILPPQTGERPARDYGETHTPEPFMTRLDKQMAVKSRLFSIGSKVPDLLKADAGFLTEDVLSCLVVRTLFGKSTPFYTDAYASGLINNRFGAGFETTACQGHYIISGESDEPDRVLDYVRSRVVSVRENGIDPALFERVRRASIGNLLSRLNSLESICYDQAYGVFYRYNEFHRFEILSSVTADQIQASIAKLDPDLFAISIISPIQESEVQP